METGDVFRMQLQSTISLCKLLAESKVKEFSYLGQSLKAIKHFGNDEDDEQLKTLIHGTVNRIQELLRFNEQLAENDNNPELKAELLIKIADSYSNSIDLRITWLEALASHHTKASIDSCTNIL